MIRIDGFYLYTLGANLKPISDVKAGSSSTDYFIPLYIARASLDEFLHRSVFQPKVSFKAGSELLATLTAITDNTTERELNAYDAYRITNGLTTFENVFNAEFGLAPFYLVSQKRGYDTAQLIENAIILFPPDLPAKVPEAVQDINQAGRCVAFELPTAAGFHIHRANESILHRYYDTATNGKPRPKGRNIGDYLNEFPKHQAGDPKVLSALKDLKDLHRNPLVHPEHSLEDIDEALALINAVQSVVVHMLRAIPKPPEPTKEAATNPVTA